MCNWWVSDRDSMNNNFTGYNTSQYNFGYIYSNKNDCNNSLYERTLLKI